MSPKFSTTVGKQLNPLAPTRPPGGTGLVAGIPMKFDSPATETLGDTASIERQGILVSEGMEKASYDLADEGVGTSIDIPLELMVPPELPGTEALTAEVFWSTFAQEFFSKIGQFDFGGAWSILSLCSTQTVEYWGTSWEEGNFDWQTPFIVFMLIVLIHNGTTYWNDQLAPKLFGVRPVTQVRMVQEDFLQSKGPTTRRRGLADDDLSLPPKQA